ncbi:MAG: hypothetical protein ACPLSP_06205 [Fervidicoccus fontis]
MFKVTGKNTEIRECVLTCREFNEKYERINFLVVQRLYNLGGAEVELDRDEVVEEVHS